MGKLNVRIPDEVHRELRIAAAKRDLTLIEAVLEALRLWVASVK